MPVQVIKATKKPTTLTQPQRTGQDKLRTLCYCRISTQAESQETSLENQVQHFTDYIDAHPNMELTGVYADNGVSGTALKNRVQFNQMLDACRNGLADQILVKSLSRWARNTVISLETIRELKSLGVGISFEKEGISTLDANGETIITILSSLAQQESDSISKNVRLGIQYLMQQGKPHLSKIKTLGLRKGEDKYDLEIVPEEADLVRRIYRDYLEGLSPAKIAANLTAEQIPTPGGKSTWYQSTIVSILENEKMCGDLLMQKYYVEDFLTHKIVKNEGALPQYFVEDHHPPIVPKEVFYQVQGEMQRRSLLRYEPDQIRFGSSNALAGRLICGRCGRVLKKYKSPGETTWRCRKRSYEKKSVTKEVEAACPCRIVPEKEVKMAILTAFNELPGLREELIRLDGGVRESMLRIDGMIEGVEEQRGRIETRLIETEMAAEETATPTDGVVESEPTPDLDYLNAELERLSADYTRLVLERAEAANKEVNIRLLLELIDAMNGSITASPGRGSEDVDVHTGAESPACYDYDDFFRRTSTIGASDVISYGRIESFSNETVVKYLEKVVVTEDGYEVWFKAGVSVSITTE